jgi:hypothetical protein
MYLKSRAGHQQKKKINVKRHRQPTPDNQKPTTTDSDSLHSTVSSRQPTTNYYHRQIQYNQHSTPIHRKKKVREFPVPSRDVTTKLSLGGNNDVITELFLPWGSLVSDIPAGDGKLVNLFLRCSQQLILNNRLRIKIWENTGI